MNSYATTLTAAAAAERERDLTRAAARSWMITDVPARDRHETARHRAPWWSRLASWGTQRTVASVR